MTENNKLDSSSAFILLRITQVIFRIAQRAWVVTLYTHASLVNLLAQETWMRKLYCDQ